MSLRAEAPAPERGNLLDHLLITHVGDRFVAIAPRDDMMKLMSLRAKAVSPKRDNLQKHLLDCTIGDCFVTLRVPRNDIKKCPPRGLATLGWTKL